MLHGPIANHNREPSTDQKGAPLERVRADAIRRTHRECQCSEVLIGAKPMLSFVLRPVTRLDDRQTACRGAFLVGSTR